MVVGKLLSDWEGNFSGAMYSGGYIFSNQFLLDLIISLKPLCFYMGLHLLRNEDWKIIMWSYYIVGFISRSPTLIPDEDEGGPNLKQPPGMYKTM